MRSSDRDFDTRAGTDTAGNSRYWAFISYSHRDAKWGAWLHKALEGFPVPKRLVGPQTGYGPLPRRLRPIFRDRDELPTASNLGAKIENALEQSRFLIVICSPHSAQSEWVNEEVLTFKRMGRGDRVLCLIVDGDPNGTDRGKPELECFCPAVRYEPSQSGDLSDKRTEPIAADVRLGHEQRSVALMRIVAGLIGVRFDDLRQRHRRARRIRLAMMSTAAAVLAAAIVAGYSSLEGQRQAEAIARARERGDRVANEAEELASRGLHELALRRLATVLPEPGTVGAPLLPSVTSVAHRLRSEFGLLRILGPHEGVPSFAVPGPHGKTLVVGSESIESPRPSIWIWNLKNGRLIGRIPRPRFVFPENIRNSASGRYVMLQSPNGIGPSLDGTLIIKRVSDGATVFDFGTADRPRIGPQGLPASAPVDGGFTSPGVALLGYENGWVYLIALDQQEVIRRFQAAGQITALSINPTGKRLAVADATYRKVKIWTLPDEKLTAALEANTKPVDLLRFAAGGRKLISVGEDRTVLVWDVAQPSQRLQLGPIKLNRFGSAKKISSIRLVSFKRDGTDHYKIFVADLGGERWQVWDDNGQKQIDSHTKAWFGQAILLPGGQHILVLPSVTGEGTKKASVLKVSDASTVRELLGSEKVVSGAVATNGGEFVGLTGQLAHIFDLSSGKRVRTLRGHGPMANFAQFTVDGRFIITGGDDRTVRIWDNTGLYSPDYVRIGNTPVDNKIARFAAGPPGRLVLTEASLSGSTVLYDYQHHIVVARYGELLPSELGAVASPTGHVVASGLSNVVVLAPGRPRLVMKHQLGLVWPALSPSGRYVVLMVPFKGDSEVRDTATGNRLCRLATWTKGIRMVAFAPDGERLVVVPQSIFDEPAIVETRSCRVLVRFGPKAPFVLTFAPSGETLFASWLHGMAQIRSVQDGTTLVSLVGHTSTISAGRFEASGRLVLAGADDGTSIVWDVKSGRRLLVLRGPKSRVTAVAASPNGRWFATATKAGSMLLWQARTGRLQKRIDKLGEVMDLRFSPDSGHLLIRAKGGVRLWQLPNRTDKEVINWMRRLVRQIEGVSRK